MELVQHTESDAWLALSLAAHLNMLPLSRQLSCITGYLWSRTLQACPCAELIHQSNINWMGMRARISTIKLASECSSC